MTNAAAGDASWDAPAGFSRVLVTGVCCLRRLADVDTMLILLMLACLHCLIVYEFSGFFQGFELAVLTLLFG